MKEYAVFVSYSRKDDVNFLRNTGKESPVDQILNRFKEEGIKNYWIDREGKYCGANYIEEIKEAISNSETVLFISSKNSNNDASKWVFREILQADEWNMTIFPFRIDETAYNSKISLIFKGIDEIEYFKNPTKGLNKLIEQIKIHLAKIKKQEEEKALAEEAERKRIEAEIEKKRIEEEERKRIAKVEKEIDDLKKRILGFVEKQQTLMKELLSKEKDLKGNVNDIEKCPICETFIPDRKIDYCENCGWHFATPKELVSTEMQRMYDERLSASKIIWTEKKQIKEELRNLKIERKNLTEKLNKSKKDLSELNGSINNNNKIKQEKISQLQKELAETKETMSQMQKELSECRKKMSDLECSDNEFSVSQPMAFLLVAEGDMTNVYCLYEGRNQFGAMQKKASTPNYQMLILSDDSLNSKHFEIIVKKEDKRLSFSILPLNNSFLAINSVSNTIFSPQNIQLNDIIYINNKDENKVTIKLIDNFNK